MHIASATVSDHAAPDDPQLPVVSGRLEAAAPLWQVAPKENATSHSGCPGIQTSDCSCVKCQDIGKCIARQGELDPGDDVNWQPPVQMFAAQEGCKSSEWEFSAGNKYDSMSYVTGVHEAGLKGDL